MHERECSLDPLVSEVGVERLQLVGREHALVTDDPRAQRREVRGRAVEHGGQGVLDVLAGEVDVTLELVAGEERARLVRLGCEDLAEHRHDLSRRLARHARVDRHVAPTQDREVLVEEHLLDRADRAVGILGRQERDTRRVFTGGREIEGHDRPEVRVGHLDRDPGAVAGVGLGARRAAVVQAARPR